MAYDYDLVVIGSGPAGEKGAAQAAYHNKRVALVEHAPKPGGIAVSSAGIPTKTLRETALYVSGFRHREVYGLSLNLDPQVTLERLMTRKSEVVTVMTRAVERNLARHGIELIQGRARLKPNRTAIGLVTPSADTTTVSPAISAFAGTKFLSSPATMKCVGA